MIIANNSTNDLPDANRYFDEIDDLNIYNREVTSAEITQLATVNSFCFAPLPTTLSFANITEISAEVSWTESGTFDLAYVLKNEPFANATIVSNINYTANGVENLTGLQPSSIYNIYLRKPCSASITSGWSPPAELRTNGITYVNMNATGTNDGTSWVNAYTSLQNAFVTLQDDGKIWVAQGTYTPDASDRNINFAIDKSNVKLYGGFNGTETTLNQRDFIANETILSGDLAGDDAGAITGTVRTENAYHVLRVNKGGVAIDGFTIRDGVANSSGDNAAGAAIFKTKAVNSLTVKNCTIKNNLAYNAAGIYAEFTSGGGTLDIENCIFDNNLARLCTSFSAWARSGGTFTFKVSNSLFSNNETRDLSGSANSTGGSSGWLRAIGNAATIVNASLINNTYVNNNDIGTHSSMSNLNRATVGASTDSGGTMNLELANSIFWNNTITGGAVGNSITGISATLGQNITAVNSIDQGSFSKLTPANLTNTSNSDPLFTGATDFTLQTTSPAKDAGDNSKILNNLSGDLAGNNRVFNSVVDMGPYEFGSSPFVIRTLTTNVVGNGTISPTNGGYSDGSTAVLTATPDAGYQFDGWSGDASGTTNPLSITMDADKTVTATFSSIQLTLTIIETHGSIVVNPNPSNIINNTGTFDYGTLVTLTATPDSGYQFDGWSGDASGIINPLNITMDVDKTITATFSLIQRTLTINATNGSVTTNPNPINGAYDNGINVELSATPDAGYQFDGWSGDASGTSNPLSITMDVDKTITATFSQIQRSLNVTIVGNGTVTLASGSSPNGTYAEGTVLSLTATAANGFGFTGWSGDANGITNPLSVIMDADKNITVTFSATASIVDINKFYFNMYPNPTKGSLFLDLKEKIKTIELYNLQGQVIRKFETKKIDISLISNGIYLLKVTTEDKKIGIKKIIKY